MNEQDQKSAALVVSSAIASGLVVPPKQAASVVPTSGDNFELSATNPMEMVECHMAAIAWCKRKIELVQNEAKELKDAFEHAVKRKWKSETLKRHWGLAEKRVIFYQKILAAFEAGYYIVPNFPVTLFAIRTTKPTPKRMWARLKDARYKNFEQEAQVLQPQQGEYQNPQPIVTKHYDSMISDPQKGDSWAFEATDWDEMEFPTNMARLHVMEAATRAMDAKVFDEVAFLPANYKRNPDPILIGRIIDPQPAGYGSQRRISFMIGWHIDTSTI